MKATVIVDALTPADAPRCAELEQILFPGDDPWSARAFLDALAWRHPYLAARSAGGAPIGTARSAGGAPISTARSAGGAPISTAREGDLLVGYAGIGFVAGPPDAEAEVHTIGVDPAFQGRGIGRALLRGLLAIADEAHATVFLEVRTDNDVARGLYESEGFAVVGLRRRYYRPSGADAHTMRRDAR
ncbi:ribosomal protein S18-alanine N-acetyltransferase [Pseudonocardia sp.]|uniref:ribosomal protein S18-alanine N-acetyltransferase n=1 Tax=Pseudonocardia sp. TaxID=60912 RepID=UPI003D0C9086